MTTTHPAHQVRRQHLVPGLLALAAGSLLAAQQEPSPGRRPPREVPTVLEFVAGHDDNLFSLPRRQEDLHALTEAKADLERGDHAAAVERLHKLLLATDGGGVVPVAPDRYLGVRLATVLTLANLPPVAAEAYSRLVHREAGALVERPLAELTRDQLQLLATRYPAERSGRAAAQRLGDLALEAGQGLLATTWFRAALDAAPFGSADEARLRDRLRCASALMQPGQFRARNATGAAGDVLAVLPPTGDAVGWAASGGGGDGSTPMTPPVGTPQSQATFDVRAPGFDQRESGLFAMQPTGDLESIFVCTGLELLAFDPLRKVPRWQSLSPLREQGGDVDGVVREYDEHINQDMVLAAAFGDDVAVAALQVPDNSENVRFQNNLQIMSKMPERRLFAFQRATGKLLWSHFDQLDGPIARRFRGHLVCGPPLVLGDTVYAPVHDRSGAIAFYVGAYDLHTGAPRWRRLVCSSQQDVNMFGNARMEFAASPMCMHEGVLYGASNLGVAYGVEAANGNLRWASAYDVVTIPQANFNHQPERTVYFCNSTPVVADGVVCTTPLDSPYVLAFDTETGRALWRVPFEASVQGPNYVRWLCGAIGDEFVLAGAGVVAARARPAAAGEERRAPELRQIIRRETLGSRADGDCGRPAVTADRVWYPAPGRAAVFDAQGNLGPGDADLRLRQSGNLLLVDGIAVALRHRNLELLWDTDALRRAAEDRVRAAPDDPAAILRLAVLRKALLPAGADDGERGAVTDLYRQALAACVRRGLPPTHPLRQSCQLELFQLALERAERAVAAKDKNAPELLAAARDVAPDARSALDAATMLIAQLDGRPELQLRELERLQEFAAVTYDFPELGSLPVAAWVAWRRAGLVAGAPAQVAAWQDLLERFGDVQFGPRPAAELARAAIDRLLQQHGAAAYAEVERRAAAALQAAGDDGNALRALVARFPNSAAAATARAHVLDLAVARGDLGSAVDVLTHVLRTEDPPPGLCRRVLAAALQAGNQALAQAMATRLRAAAGTTSDFPPDQGKSYGDVLAGLPAPEATAAPSVQLPAQVVAQVRPRGGKANLVPLATVVADGFAAAPQVPLYAIWTDTSRSDQVPMLQAIDVHATTPEKPVLFERAVGFLEQVVLCGRVLVLTDLNRVLGIDYRTGELRWELPGPDKRFYDLLGARSGVVHVVRSTGDLGGVDCLGIEPLTGRQLFARPLPAERTTSFPKVCGDQLLLLEAPVGADPALLRLDPVTGRTVATIPLDAAAVQRLGVRSEQLRSVKTFAQGFAADGERVYVPIDTALTDDAPKVVAFDGRGTVVWQWTGRRGRQLAAAALRGNRYAIVESGEDNGGKDGGSRALVLDAVSGTVLREHAFAHEVDVLNWRKNRMPTPAPDRLVLVDRRTRTPADRRLTVFPVDDALTGFDVPLASDDGDGERMPAFGDGFLVFGMRPEMRLRGPFRVYALRLDDRKGALPGGRKYLQPVRGATFGMSTAGPYTVVSTAEGILVLGDGSTPR